MTTKVHRIRFYSPKPRTINYVSYNKISKLAAIAREDASIEIWDLSHTPFLLKYLPGVENGSIEALGWVNDRLLSTGLGGALIEWDLNKLALKRTVLLTGYAAWCLDIDPKCSVVAVGTEQGYVNLFSVENDDIIYKKLFDKQEGRILCCKFDKTGNILVTGSINTIRVWNVETGQAITRMSTKRRGKEVIVWSLGVLSDSTVVSGESGGRLTFWDMNSGDQIESFTTHKSDILSVVVSENEDSIYCSGVDPVIVNFVKVPAHKSSKNGCMWAKNVQRHIHEHDVRCLALQENKLISVGLDGYLTFSSFPPKWVMRIPPMLPTPRSSVSEKRKLLLLRYTDHIEVWKLGVYATNTEGEPVASKKQTKETTPQPITNGHSNLECDSSMDMGNKDNRQNVTLELKENPLKLVSIQSKGHKQIRCCEISPNGKTIVYSTDSDIRMLHLDMDDEDSAVNTSLSKIPVSGVPSTTCDRLTFTADSRHLLAHSYGTVYVLQIDAAAGATLVQSVPVHEYLKSPTLLHLVASNKCQSGVTYFLAADTRGSVAAWSTAGGKYEHCVTLPTYQCVPSAVTVDSATESVVAVYVDQKVIEYNLKSKKIVENIGRRLPPQWYNNSNCVTDVRPRPGNSNTIVFRTDTALNILEPSNQEEPVSKKKSRKSESGNATLRSIPVKYSVGFHYLSAEEAVLVECTPESIVRQLPEGHARKLPPAL